MWQVLAYTLIALTAVGVFFAIREELCRHREEQRQRRLNYWRGVDKPAPSDDLPFPKMRSLGRVRLRVTRVGKLQMPSLGGVDSDGC